MGKSREMEEKVSWEGKNGRRQGSGQQDSLKGGHEVREVGSIGVVTSSCSLL